MKLCKTILLLSACYAQASLTMAEPAAASPVNFKEIRLIPISFQEDFKKADDWRVIHKYPHKMSELHFYNGDQKIANGRDSLTSSRVSHVLYDALSDGDLTTSTDWSKLTYPASIHGVFKEYGHRMQYVFEQTATHAIIATPDVKSLKNLRLSLFQGETEHIDFDLSTLSAAGESEVYKLDLATKEVTLLPELPASIQAYKPLQAKEAIKGKFLEFTNPVSLEKVSTKALNGNTEWAVKDKTAVLQWRGNVRNKQSKLEGSMELPWTLAPGQSLLLDIDGGYDTWLSETELTVQLGNSSFVLKEHKDLLMPNQDQYTAATSRGVGAIEYQLLFKRGKGRSQHLISWAIIGNGYNRSGQTELLPEDKSNQVLPIKLNVLRPWRWVWYNLAEEGKWEGPYINELGIRGAGVGTFIGKLPPLEKAVFFKKPNFATNNGKQVQKKLASMNLPKLSPYPLENSKAPKGKITDKEIAKIKPWLKALPMPKSNNRLQLEWNEHGISERIHSLLEASGDRDLLDILVLRAEATIDWRNDNDKYRISFISERLPEGKELKYTWPSGAGKVYLNGKSHQVADTWDYSSWLNYMLVTDYISKHPEIYKHKVRVGKYAGKVTYLELANHLIDEAFLTIEQLIFMYSDPETLHFTRPWNRYTTNVQAFHYLNSTFENLKKNKVSVDEKRATTAKKAVNEFLRSFFDPTHFEIYQVEEHPGIDFMTFRYSEAPTAPAEDKQHASAELHVLKTLYASNLYSELFKDEYVKIIGNTLKHRIYKGTGSDGKEIFAATFAKEPAMKHAGTRDGLPYSCLWAFKYDPESYLQFAKMYDKSEAKTWSDYAQALIMRVEKETFLDQK